MYIPHFVHPFTWSLTFQFFLPFGYSDNAAMKICVQGSVEALTAVLLGLYLGVELLSYMVILC